MADQSVGPLREAGEAIGNVGRRLFRRRVRRQEARAALERWRQLVPAPQAKPTRQSRSSVDDNVIDTTWRIIESSEEENND